jgi:hypothetical protein
MVLHIHSRWRALHSASAQIEPMINIYLKYSYPHRDEELTYRNLALNTFNYMLDTDDTLKVPPSSCRYPPADEESDTYL